MNRFWNTPWVNRVLALLLAIGLFAYVNAENINNTRQNNRDDATLIATKTQTVHVPLQLTANTERYFITGYPEKVAVKLTGTASLVTMTANTQNFRVTADLSNLGVGKHTVRLKVSGLNKDLSYSIDPKTIAVDIQIRDTKTMPIQVRYSDDSIASGYAAGTAKLSSSTVEITGARSVIDSVAQVIAGVSLKKNTKADVDQEVLLQALDANGKAVNVVLNPQTVHVTLPISQPSKQVDVDLKQTGTAADGRTYALKTATKSVTIYGDRQALNQIDAITIPIDISEITQNTTRTFRLTDVNDAFSASDPATIKVEITVANPTSSSSQSSSASSPAQSSSSRDSSSSASSSASSESNE